MSDVGEFFIGVATTAIGVGVSFLPIPGAQFLGMALISFGTGKLLRGAFGRPEQEGQEQNITSTVASLPVVYGTAKIGGKVIETQVDTSSTDNEDLYRVLALCVGSEDGSGINSVQTVKFDEQLAISNPVEQDLAVSNSGIDSFWIDGGVPHFWYGLHLGSDSQTVDGKLNLTFPSRWPSTSEGKGIAYMPFQLRHDKEKWSGIPNMTFKVEGNNVYDPRDDTWKFSDNPALCILDYIASDRYGFGANYTERDGGTVASEIDEQSFIDAANYCDELVQDGSGGTQKRFTCNGWVNTGASLQQNLNALLSSCRGEVIYQGGKFRLLVRRAKTVSGIKLDESNIIGDWSFRRGGVQDVPNSLIAKYVDADDDFSTREVVWPPRDSNSFLTDDNDYSNQEEIELPFTNNDVTAQQIAMVTLKEAREDVSISVTCTEELLQAEVGDVIELSHDTPGYTDKKFWIAGMGYKPDQTIALSLREYADSAYTLDPQSDFATVPAGDLPDPFSIADPTNLSLTSGDSTALDLGDAKAPRVLASWTPPSDTFYDHAEVRFKPITDANGATIADGKWQKAPQVDANDDQQVYLNQVKNGYEYTVEVRAVNRIGRTSAWVSGNVTVSVTGARYPIIKLTTTESGGSGTVDAEVIDPGSSDTITVDFFERVGQGGFPGTADQTNASVSSSSVVSYTATLDPTRNTYVKVEATLDTSGNTATAIATLDKDTSAEIDNLAATIDEDTGEVVVTIDGDSDAAKHYITVDLNAIPADPDGVNQDDTLNSRSGTVNTGVTASRGDTAYVKVRSENSAGTLAPTQNIRLTSTTYGKKGAGFPSILIDASEATDGSSGSLTATVVDPDGGNLTVRFWTRQGFGGYGAVDATFTGVPSGTGKSHSVNLVDKRNSWIKVEAEVESNGKKNSKEVAFDPDKSATLTSLSASVNDSGSVIVDASGDADTASIDVAFGAPVNENKTISGRSGSVSSTSTVSLGTTVSITATPVNGDGVSGSSGTTTATHPKGETKSNVPTIDASKTDNGDGTVTVTFTGSTGPAGVGPIEVATKSGILGMGSFGGFSSSPVSVTVTRNVIFPTDVVGKARDTGADGTPESDPVTVTVAPLHDFFTPPGGPGTAGRPKRGFPYDDGDYPARAIDTSGHQLPTESKDSRGKNLDTFTDLLSTGGASQVFGQDIAPGAVTGPKTQQPGTDPGGGQTRIPQPQFPRWNGGRDRNMASGWSAEAGVVASAVALSGGGVGSGFAARTGRGGDSFGAIPGVVETQKSKLESAMAKVMVKDAGGNITTNQMSVEPQQDQSETTDAEVARLDLRDDNSDGIYDAIFTTRGTVGSVRFEVFKNGVVQDRAIINSAEGRITVNGGDSLSTGEVWRVEATPYEGADASGVEGDTVSAEVGDAGGTGNAEIVPGDSSSVQLADSTAAERLQNGDCSTSTDMQNRITYSTANGGSSVRVRQSINGGTFSTVKTGLSTGVAQTWDQSIANRAYDPNGTKEKRTYKVELLDGSNNVLDSFISGGVDNSYIACGQQAGGSTPSPGDEGGDPRITSASASRTNDGTCSSDTAMAITASYDTADAPSGAVISVDRQIDSGGFVNIASDLPVGNNSKSELVPNREYNGAGTAETRTYRIRLLDAAGQTIAQSTTSAVDTSFDVCSASAAAISVSASRTQDGICTSSFFLPMEVSITYDTDNAPSGARVEIDVAIDDGSGFGSWITLATNLTTGDNQTIINSLGDLVYAAAGVSENRKYRARLVDSSGNDVVSSQSGTVDTNYNPCPVGGSGTTFQ